MSSFLSAISSSLQDKGISQTLPPLFDDRVFYPAVANTTISSLLHIHCLPWLLAISWLPLLLLMSIYCQFCTWYIQPKPFLCNIQKNILIVSFFFPLFMQLPSYFSISPSSFLYISLSLLLNFLSWSSVKCQVSKPYVNTGRTHRLYTFLQREW